MIRGISLSVMLAAGAVMLGGCVEQEPDRPSTKDLQEIKKHILKTAPATMRYKVNADLEGRVVYLGADVDRKTVKPGVQFTLTHYWQVKKPISGWKIFVHLNDEGKKEFVNADHKPIGGRYPATFWKAGEIIRDIHKVTLPPKWKAKKVQVFTGLWKGKLRMKPKGPADKDNRVLAATIDVEVSAAPAPKATPKKRLIAVKTDKPVKLDGKLDDEVWKKAPLSGLFVDTMKGTKAPIETQARVAWDDKFLYIAFDNRDEDVWSELKKRDDKLWTQEVVEIFIDANADGKDYIELQVNPNGAVFDSYLASYRKNDNAWNSKLTAKVSVDGTLNKRGDKDKGWTVEIAIPWADTKGKGNYELKLPPEPGNTWLVNFFRFDKPKKGPQLAAAWSAPMIGDFHKLDRFGELVFADAEGKVPPKTSSVVVPAKTAPAATAVVPRGTVGNVVKMAVPKKRTMETLRGRTAVIKKMAGKKPAK